MANIATRRLLGQNLSKFMELTHYTNHARCTSTFVLNINHKNDTLFNNYNKKLLYSIQGRNSIQHYSENKQCKNEDDPKPTVFQKFKQMYKEYWYVLVPVHIVTSAAWFGGFYYLAKSGVDIPVLLESWHVSEKITTPLKDSHMGYLAVAYALYKIATPARYTVTLGGTTVSINYLKKWGYIKPVPSKEKLKKLYHERKDHLLGTVRETKEDLKVQTEKLKDTKENIIENFDKSISQIKELGDRIKSKGHIVEDLNKKGKGCKDKK